MKKSLKNLKTGLPFLFLILISVSLIAQNDKLTNIIAGNWQGKLTAAGNVLTLVVKIKQADNQGFKASMDSPDQGAKDIEVSSIIVKDDSLVFSSSPIKGSFAGKYDNASRKILGQWKQGGMKFELNLEKTDKAIQIKRPQEPLPPYPYKTEEVSFKNVNGGFTLAGTLSFPDKKGPFPAIILITGSGPQNRDEEIMGHKPFLVLADYLTKKGFAVLRYDDRGTAASGGTFKTATTFDFVTDAKSAFDFLRSDSRIISSKIGFIGHSEGGLIAPIVATQNLATAFIVLLAGPSVKGEEILFAQQELIGKASGSSEKEIKENFKLNKEIYGILKKVSDTSQAATKIAGIIEKEAANSEQLKSMDKETLSKFIDSQVRTLNSPWFRTFISLDPADYLEQVRCPVLALYGEKDLQVPPSINVKPLKKALTKAGNADYQVIEFPGLNHLFQTAKTGSPDEYSKLEETMSPRAMESIASWISLKTK